MTATAVTTRPPDEPEPTPTRRTPVARLRRWFTVPWVACLVLFGACALSSLVNDPRGTMLADSGGKLATLRVMNERGTLDPDIGYWASEHDPDGDLHPLTYTKHIGDAWVQASTLPMLDAAFPLYEVGGTRAALLLPMFGGVLCALAARALARRFGGPGETGWTAFWAVGLLTPVVLYATSFWEHTLGLAALLWAIVATIDLVRDPTAWTRAAAAGALFGAAVTLRGEALVYGAVTVVCAVVLVRRARVPWGRVAVLGVCGAAAFAAVVGANHLLESATLRDAVRVSGSSGVAYAARETGDVLSDRLSAAVTSVIAVNGFRADDLLGLLAVAAVCIAVWSLCGATRRPRIATGAGVLAVVLFALGVRGGISYVPGLLVASPLAAVGVVAVVRSRALRLLGWLAIAPLPIIWVTQYADTQRFQWGNRYALTSGVLLAVAAVVALRRERAAIAVALGLAVLVTGFGLAFVAHRSHSIADGMSALAERRGVLVSVEPHLLREGGDFYRPDRRWLTAATMDELDRAASVAETDGAATITVVAQARTVLPREIGPYRRVSTSHLRVRPDEPLSVVEYRR